MVRLVGREREGVVVKERLQKRRGLQSMKRKGWWRTALGSLNNMVPNKWAIQGGDQTERTQGNPRVRV
ncbi:hypothetical protein VNO78_32049 [Psophocarpus tetragonolobus]|uniref:Uncharacterized protein n=1 Tax=Psophocarpus tetragonolobus TaxID=3891 RepID=A0AAN9XA46_PSOTE